MDIFAKHLAGFPWNHRYQFTDVVAVRLVRRLVGRSQAVLLLGDNGKYYVAKLNYEFGLYTDCQSSIYDPEREFNRLSELNVNIGTSDEFLGYTLQCCLGLPSPRYGRIFLSESFINGPALEQLAFQTKVGPFRPTQGFHFATEYLGLEFETKRRLYPLRFTDYVSAADISLIRNRKDFLGALVLDLFMGKPDNRKVLLRGRRFLKAYFIDQSLPFDISQKSKAPFAPLHLQHRVYGGLWNQDAIDLWMRWLMVIVPKVLDMTVPFQHRKSTRNNTRLGKAAALDRIQMIPALLRPFEDELRRDTKRE